MFTGLGWSARIRRSIWLLALAPLFVSAGAAYAQAPAAEPPANKHYHNEPVFHLPIRIDDRDRPRIREVQLFVKAGNGDWQRKDIAPAWQQAFKYKSPADGEYWFTLVTIDGGGVARPADLNGLSAQNIVKVVVDTQSPAIELQPVKLANGDLGLNCLIKDANPDFKSIKITGYEGAAATGQGMRTLEPVQGQPGLYRISSAEVLAYPLQVTAFDLAGNATTKEINLQEWVAKLTPAPEPAPVVHATAPPHQQGQTNVQQVGGVPPNLVGNQNSIGGNVTPLTGGNPAPAAVNPGPAPSNPAPVNNNPAPAVVNPNPPAGAPVQQNPAPVAPMPVQVNPAPATNANHNQPAPTTGANQNNQPSPAANTQVVEPRPAAVQGTNPPAGGTQTTEVRQPAAQTVQSHTVQSGSMTRQLINTPRVSLDYRIDQVGPSGVGKVEVWITTDQGATWKRHCEDADRRGPAEFDLPADGLYGVRVVVTNGNGFGGRSPTPGEQPQLWVEVDTAAPVVLLKEVEPTTNGGTLDIRWTVSDKNLASEPVNLLYSTRREGPWLSIARNVKNDGLYRWTFPRDAGSQFFVRLEAADQAGNLARCDSTTAIVLDMTEPRANVVGVTGVQGPGRN